MRETGPTKTASPTPVEANVELVTGPSAMLNCIGTMPERAAVLAVPDTHFHDYGKAARVGRKLGHVTVRAPDVKTLAERLATLRPKIWPG